MIKGVLLDLSGTIYVDNEVLPRALEAVQKLQAKKIPMRYLTLALVVLARKYCKN